ncbi:hypothetical protein CR970_03005 [Candidatus Saccharibacteria bacterium]|nr:MAG: hypothetical protein CR970_03005 [Candidatus Saccharibacteria bacterium]
MEKVVKQIRSSEFLRHNAVFFAGAMVVGAANYLYYPIMGRLLHDPIAYGDVQVLTVLYNQLTLPTLVLSQVAINVVTNADSAAVRSRMLFMLEKFGMLVSLVLIGILGLLTWQLKDFLQLASIPAYLVLLAAVAIGTPMAFRNAYLRARKAFRRNATSLNIGAVTKLLGAALLVIAGAGSAGAVGGLVVGQALALIYAMRWASRLGLTQPANYWRTLSLPWRKLLPELRFSLLALSCLLGVSLLSTLDVLVVKHYFDPQIAGEYAGVSTVAKIIFFATGSIAQVMLPSIKLANSQRANASILAKSAVLLTAVGGSATLVLVLFSDLTVRLLMGSAYLPFAHLLPALGIAMFVVSLVNVLALYYMALRSYIVGGIMLVSAVGTAMLMAWRHDSLEHIIYNLMLGASLTLIVLIVWTVHQAIRNQPTTQK